jgi:hypothetical protein
VSELLLRWLRRQPLMVKYLFAVIGGTIPAPLVGLASGASLASTLLWYVPLVVVFAGAMTLSAWPRRMDLVKQRTDARKRRTAAR